eukprot:5449091-Prymnesium_polylepis.1
MTTDEMRSDASQHLWQYDCLCALPDGHSLHGLHGGMSVSAPVSYPSNWCTRMPAALRSLLGPLPRLDGRTRVNTLSYKL